MTRQHSRRRFLHHAGALAAGSTLGLPLASQAGLATGPYRALVCVFLYGGNDGNNMVVPMDTAGYAAYAQARGNAAAGGLALQQSALAPLPGSSLGLHPGLAPLATLWSQGHLAVQANVGTLVRPVSKATLASTPALAPPDLYSHADQQDQWQAGASGLVLPTGWAGRVADLQGTTAVPSVISFAGNSLFINGASQAGLVLPSKGGFSVKGFGATPTSNPLFGLYSKLLATANPNKDVAAAAGVMQQALQASALLNPALSASGATSGLFAGQTNGLAQQLLAVAKLIEARSTLGVNRQIFMVSLGGFDTHNDQLNRQGALLGQLGPALKAFHDAMAQLGLGAQVTSYTASDFGRTLQPASGGGTDHAWGNHQLVLGGAVKGGVYGRMPQLVLRGPDDVSAEGRWLPSTSVAQMGASLAAWLGVSNADLAKVFPNLGNFSQKTLPYFG